MNEKEELYCLTDTEKSFMDVAFKYAREALSKQEVPVGCIFVYNNEIIALGRNDVNETHNASRHAELICIDQVISYCKKNNFDFNFLFPNLTVYVTVEPCIMCAAALYDLHVKSIVYGCRNDRFGGLSVFDVGSVLKPNTSLKGGYCAQVAMDLLKQFYKGTNPNAPPCKVNKRKNFK